MIQQCLKSWRLDIYTLFHSNVLCSLEKCGEEAERWNRWLLGLWPERRWSASNIPALFKTPKPCLTHWVGPSTSAKYSPTSPGEWNLGMLTLQHPALFWLIVQYSIAFCIISRTALLLRTEIKSEHRFLWLGSDLTTLTVSRRAEQGLSLRLFWSKWSECEWPESASGPEKQWNPRKR